MFNSLREECRRAPSIALNHVLITGKRSHVKKYKGLVQLFSMVGLKLDLFLCSTAYCLYKTVYLGSHSWIILLVYFWSKLLLTLRRSLFVKYQIIIINLMQFSTAFCRPTSACFHFHSEIVQFWICAKQYDPTMRSYLTT